MVGSAMAIDMAAKHAVTLTDISPERLKRVQLKHGDLEVRHLDVTDNTSLSETIGPFDLVICAVPGFLGFETLKTIIEAGKNVVDISFFSENALDLDALAREKNVTAIVDCGVAPGMDNILLGHHDENMKVASFECLVGGLPKVKKWPFCYKAPFSPIDVIEEYTRPARYVENGVEIVREPLTDCEYVEFDGVGTLESFNTDGLRSIIHTMSHIPNMKEKTLRYPGHVEYIMALKQSGFFSKQEIEFGGRHVRPLDFTSKVLIDEWKLGEEEEELTKGQIAASMAIAFVIFAGLFIVLPAVAAGWMAGGSGVAFAAIEAVLRMVLFIGYIWAIGRSKEIRRVFQYHGAEHMSIHAFEAGEPLSVDSVARYRPEHPRCGTNFLMIVIILSIVIFTFVGQPGWFWLIVSRVVGIPVIAGLSYEVLKIAGTRQGERLGRILAAPGLWLQKLTTVVPERDMIEVAVASLLSALEPHQVDEVVGRGGLPEAALEARAV